MHGIICPNWMVVDAIQAILSLQIETVCLFYIIPGKFATFVFIQIIYEFVQRVQETKKRIHGSATGWLP